MASIVSTETSAVTFISVPGYAFGTDYTFLQLPMGYIVGRVVVSLLFVPAYFRGEVLTVYQLLGGRFGGTVKQLASGLFLVTRTLSDGFRLFATGLVLARALRRDAGRSRRSAARWCRRRSGEGAAGGGGRGPGRRDDRLHVPRRDDRAHLDRRHPARASTWSARWRRRSSCWQRDPGRLGRGLRARDGAGQSCACSTSPSSLRAATRSGPASSAARS